jgi:hypothetical protein
MTKVVKDHQEVTKKKKMTIFPSQITNFFGNHKPYNKSNLEQLVFLENLVL